MCSYLLHRSLGSVCNLGGEREGAKNKRERRFYNPEANVAGLEIIVVAIYLSAQTELCFVSNGKSSACFLQGKIALRSHKEAN